MGGRASRTVAVILILAHTAAFAPAYPFDEARGAGRARLERGLERAGKETNMARWEELSRAGLEEALAEWEARTLYMKEAGEEAWEAERESAAGEYALLVEKGYAEWLAGKFFEEAEDGSGAFRARLAAAAREWEYEGTRIIGAGDAGAAAAAWENEVGGVLAAEYLAAWDGRAEAGIREIVSRLAGRGADAEALLEAASGVGVSYREYARAEYGRIARAEENALLRALLYDSASAQKLSEEEAARRVAGYAGPRGHRGIPGVIGVRTTSYASTKQFGEAGLADKDKIRGN
ncbi:MAG: hypothetical protein LBG27_13815 [Spirochaetaceae bacterium]|jgi:hypothetical protein|nr:hypothetical protein [Spirochaetaceae bacterium]